MKKLAVIFLSLVIALSAASCGKKDGEKETEANKETNVQTEEQNGGNEEETDLNESFEDEGFEEEESVPYEPVTDTEKALNAGWSKLADDERFFAMGGDAETPVDGAPGNFSIADAEALDSTLGFPAASVGSIDEAASLLHAMNANTFTGAAYRVAEGVDADALADDIKTNILARQWMCGFPETLIIIKADDILITAFGDGEIIENYRNNTLSALEGATLVTETPIA